MRSPGAENGVVSLDSENVPPRRGDRDIRGLLESLMLPPSPAQQRLLELIKKHPEMLGSKKTSGEPIEGSERRGRLDRGRTAASTPAPDANDGASTACGNARSSPAVLLPLVVDYANGMTQLDIARKHRLHVQTVRKRLGEAGVRVREHNRALSDEDLWHARRLLDGGVGSREVAQRYQVAHTTLLRALKRDTSPVEPRAEQRPWRDDPIEENSPNEVTGDDTGVPLPQERDGILDARGRVVRSSERRLFPRYLKPDDVDSLVADYSAGMPVGKIAEKYGIHRATVTAHLRRREIPAPAAGLDRRQRAEAVRLYREGLSLREVGRRLGADRKLVRAALVAEGEEIRPRPT